ncbi:TIGR02281 family clan AA aspartic protease [Thiocapsa imhoffii]|uniref:TIGR02281 family clan AA aspartic protease n=1 Tax=Thiocapsa imhoffii TaxID=382777 RepID=A0A9X1B7D1_9GAMM|nr:TIGR02281 family clan AA aspartic protease [Thiocapsa imhoffii]MBK1643547.1 TIGR02281 family clan AA aspartic protease [Thiocapsa imhoffii]
MKREPPSADDMPSKVGRVMLFGAWLTGLALLAMFFNELIERRENPNPSPVMVSDQGIPEVRLERNRAGHYVTTGAINGVSVRFLVDTGATDVALPLALAQRLSLPLRPGGMSKTANGMVRTWRTQLDSVDVGGLVGRNVRATVLPNMPGNEVLLGMSYLKHLEMVQRGRVLTLRPHVGP